jgi:hypothetical protein
MSTTEIALNNLIIGQGWERDAATPERLGKFLNPRAAELALVNVTADSLEQMSDEEFDQLLAA